MKISANMLKAECLRRRYARLLEQPDTFPSSKNWVYIIENRMQGLGPALYRKYLVARMLDEDKRSGLHTSALKHFPEYLRAVEREHALDTLYGDPDTLPEAFVELVHECELFDAPRLLGMLRSGDAVRVCAAVDALDAFQPEYDEPTLEAMERLCRRLDELPVLGHVEQRRGMLGRQERYICPNGHASDIDKEYCPVCGLDIYGLNAGQRQLVGALGERTEALRSLLQNAEKGLL